MVVSFQRHQRRPRGSLRVPVSAYAQPHPALHCLKPIVHVCKKAEADHVLRATCCHPWSPSIVNMRREGKMFASALQPCVYSAERGVWERCSHHVQYHPTVLSPSEHLAALDEEAAAFVRAHAAEEKGASVACDLPHNYHKDGGPVGSWASLRLGDGGWGRGGARCPKRRDGRPQDDVSCAYVLKDLERRVMRQAS